MVTSREAWPTSAAFPKEAAPQSRHAIPDASPTRSAPPPVQRLGWRAAPRIRGHARAAAKQGSSLRATGATAKRSPPPRRWRESRNWPAGKIGDERHKVMMFQHHHEYQGAVLMLEIEHLSPLVGISNADYPVQIPRPDQIARRGGGWEEK